jgi:hypothetical protein
MTGVNEGPAYEYAYLISELFQGVKLLLAPRGSIQCRHSIYGFRRFSGRRLFLGSGHDPQVCREDRGGESPKRSLLAFSDRRTSPPEDTVEMMMTGEGHPTEWWSRLTQDFYLKK